MDEIIFITSNNIKLAHIRYIARMYDVLITKQKYYGIGYSEPRVLDRQELLKNSIEDARKRLRKTKSGFEERVFFIEDTSVNIPALMPDKEEYPGVDIKYWMKKNDFYSLDKMLKGNGNDRTAIVRSDVALVFSKDLEEKIGKPYEIFTSQVEGRIVDSEINIKTQTYFSWLDDRSFNKWFIPKGGNLPLSALPIDIADKFDFRAGAISEMLEFLLKFGIIRKKKSNYSPGIQLSFFLPHILIITGPTCAGKTTIAEYLNKEYKFYHLEASDFMKVRFLEHHGPNSDIKIADFAEKALLVDPGIVVNQIIKNLKQHLGYSKVITGFRSPKEIEEFIKCYDNEFQVQVIYIDADFEKRYERSLIRKRSDIKLTIDQFKLLDSQQMRMGLDEISLQFSENKIYNNSTKNDYYLRFINKYNNIIYKRLEKDSKDDNSIEKKLEEIIILSLYQEKNKSYFTTTQISYLIKKYFPNNPKNKNNISRYFNQNFYPYYDIILEKGKKKFKLSQTGLSKAKLLFDSIQN